MTKRRIWLSLAGAAAIGAIACSEPPTRATGPDPEAASPPTLNLTTEQRDQLGAALVFAGAHSGRLVLDRRQAGEQVAAAFERVADRLDANDRVGTERAIAAARAALRRYQELSEDDGGATAPELAAMTLTLDHASALLEEVEAPTTPIEPSTTERQP